MSIYIPNVSIYIPNWQTKVKTKEVAMTEAVEEIVVPDTPAELTTPQFERLDPEKALQACDGHASRAVNAVVFVLLPTGGELLMCGNCARRHFGYEHTAHAPKEDKVKGSSH